MVLAVFMLVKDNFAKDKIDEIKGLAVVESSDSSLQAMAEPDSDSDGLKDWEEVIFGTDPQDPDTDNDGITDKQEYSNASTTIATSNLLSSRNSDSLTGATGIELFSQYASLKQTDSFNPTNIDLLAERVVLELQGSVKNESYVAGDMLVQTGSSNEAIRAYGNTLASIRDSYFEEYKKSPVVSPAGTGLSDPAFVEGLKRASGIYLRMSKDIMALSVPYEIANSHLELANNYLNSSVSLNETVAGSDPLKSAASLGAYINLQAEEYNILYQISLYLKQNGIIYTTDESGSFWTLQ